MKDIGQKIKNKKNKFLLANGNLGVLVALTLSFMLMFSFNYTNAWHENLGIDNNKAAELYQTKPNDPAIVQWKSALHSAINGMDKCFEVRSAIACQNLISTIISNCKSHPNTLLACNDDRLAQYSVILNKSQEAYLTKIPQYAASVIEKCFSNPDSNTTYEVASPSCDDELVSLQHDCQLASSPYDYCTDEWFVGYLKKNGITNSTATP
jgi:hypothetical protein